MATFDLVRCFLRRLFERELFGVARARREPRTFLCCSYLANVFADREWNRIRELLDLLCSSLESTSWGLASIVQRCQQKFREMRGFFPTRENVFLELTQKCQQWLPKVGSEDEGEIPLKRVGLKFTIPVMHEFRKRGYNSRQPASKVQS